MEQNGYSQTIENILQAMSEITNAQSKSLSFDKTIKAIITDASSADKGTYRVSQIGAEKTGTFIAHSDNTSYQLNDCVYITIPEGDMTSSNKIIIGKYVDDTESYYNYVNPMDGFLDITGNLIEFPQKSRWDLTANFETLSNVEVWSQQDLALRGYDRLAIKGQFKTWLQGSDINSGTFGLVLIIEDATGKFTTYKLTSKEMYGNPYYYETYYLQELLVNISGIEEIRSMYLAFIQDNDFYKSDGERASGVDDTGARAPANIFMQNPYISVGYDVSNFSGDDLRIFTEDEQTFNSQDASEQRTIKANWIHAAEGRSAVIVDDITEMPLNPDYDATTSGAELFPTPVTKADLVWFEYDIEYGGAHFAAGQGWREVEDDSTVNNFEFTFNTPSGGTTDGEANNLPYVKYKAMIMTPSLRYVNSTFVNTDAYTNLAAECKDVTRKDLYNECLGIFHQIMNGEVTYNDGKTSITAKYKDIKNDDISNFNTALNAYLTMRSEIQWVDSGELIFPNTGYAPGKYAEGAIANLRIDVDPEGLKGKYLLYDDTGYMSDHTEATKERYCEALYDTIAGVVNAEGTSASDIAYEVDATETISWYIPLTSTMIATPASGKEFYGGDTVDENYRILTGELDDKGNLNQKPEVGKIPDGLYCKITRVPQFDETTVDEELMLAEHHMFARQYFRIKDYYTQLETNNMIYCRIVKASVPWYAVGNLEFGVAGTNGTDATFVLKMYEVNADNSKSPIEASALSLSTTYYEMDKDDNALKLTGPQAGKVMLVPKLYDYNKKEVENYFNSTNITYKFYSGQEARSPFTLSSVNGDGSILIGWETGATGFSINDFSTNYNYYLVMEAEVPYKMVYNFMVYRAEAKEGDEDYLSEEAKLLGKKIGDYVLDDHGNKKPLKKDGKESTRDDYLKTYLPISIVKNKIQQYKVVPPDPSEGGGDSNNGSNTEEDPIAPPNPADYLSQIVGANRVIYDRNGSNASFYKDPYILYDDNLNPVEGVSWSASIKAVDDAPAAEKATVASFYPTVTASNLLQPLEMFMLGTDETIPDFCVVGKKDNKIVCVQPVLIIQNKYGSSMLNKWDGSLTIDEKNGTILASMVGAGIKDRNNTFSGVLMGEVSQAFKDNHNGLGLYGFHQNDQSFGFNIDGRAFIGKAGHGRIWFDGNNGTITSGTYSDGVSDKYKIVGTNDIRPQQGMEIDLDGSDNISSSVKMFGPTGGFVVDTKGIVTDRYGRSNPEDAANRSLVFKLFTGAYETSERGMIYFDNDGQYIQSTNYDGYYNYTVAEDGTITSKHDKRLGLNENEDLRHLESKGIKFAKYPAGLNGQSIPPGWIPEDRLNLNLADPSYQDHPATAGAFIDLQNGWVDMRNGIIGGWQLGKSSLMTPKQEIVLWAGDKTSNDDKKKFPYIQLGSVVNGEMQGRLWIADYQVIGKTIDPGQDGVDIVSIAWGNTTLSSSGFDGFSDGNTSSKVADLTNLSTAALDTNPFKTRALNSWALQDDTIQNRAIGIGVVLETATSSNDEDDDTTNDQGSMIIWRPSWVDNKKVTSSLGTLDRPWGSVFADKGLFLKETFVGFDGTTSSGWHLVATQDWTSKVITAALNRRIKDVNNLASSALTKAKDAISDITNWAATFDGRKFITDLVTVERDAGTRLKFKVTTITATKTDSGGLTGEVSAAVEEKDTDFTAWDIVNGYTDINIALRGRTLSYSTTNGVSYCVAVNSWGLRDHTHALSATYESGVLTLGEAKKSVSGDTSDTITLDSSTIPDGTTTISATLTSLQNQIDKLVTAVKNHKHSGSGSFSGNNHKHEQTTDTHTKDAKPSGSVSVTVGAATGHGLT